MNKWLILFAGVSTVFIALIAIIGIIQLFHLIFGGRPVAKKNKKGAAKDAQGGQDTVLAAQAAPKNPVAPSPTTPAAAGTELVAVIAAAISAASGISTSAFRIASIQPAAGDQGFNTPVWGRIERFNRQ